MEAPFQHEDKGAVTAAPSTGARKSNPRLVLGASLLESKLLKGGLYRDVSLGLIKENTRR